MLKRVASRIALLPLIFSALAHGAAPVTTCDRTVFAPVEGSGQSVSVPMLALNAAQAADTVTEIERFSTQSNFSVHGCQPELPGCYGDNGSTAYDFDKNFDNLGRLYGTTGEAKTRIETGKTPAGWGYWVDEIRTCSWGPSVTTLCQHTCTQRTEAAPGS